MGQVVLSTASPWHEEDQLEAVWCWTNKSCSLKTDKLYNRGRDFAEKEVKPLKSPSQPKLFCDFMEISAGTCPGLSSGRVREGAEVSWLLLVVLTWLRTQKGVVTINNEQDWCFLLFPYS